MALKTICRGAEWASLRAEITRLRLVGLGSRSIRRSLKAAFWKEVPFFGVFPNVKRINLWYETVRWVHEYSRSEALSRAAYADRSEEAAMEYDSDWAVYDLKVDQLPYDLKVDQLAYGMDDAGPRECIVKWNETVTWLDNFDRGDCTHPGSWKVFFIR